MNTILNTASSFSQFPFSGRVVPELGDEIIREWFAYSYRVIYRVESQDSSLQTQVGSHLTIQRRDPTTAWNGLTGD